jgi:PAS domain S-box-containing protein
MRRPNDSDGGSVLPINESAHTHDGNIMLVDDNPANLRLLEKILGQQGYSIRAFTRGTMALAAAQQELPDLVLLDINMPEMNGYEVCGHFKSDERLAGIPVIFISALNATEDKVKGFRTGGVDYISKPFQIEEVQIRVATHIKLRRAQQAERDLLEETLGRAVATRLQAEKTRAFLASIVECSDDSIIGTDLDGQIISWNPASEKLFGYTSTEAVGKHITLIFAPGQQDEDLTPRERIKNHERVERFETLRVGKDGAPIEVSGILAPVKDASGQVQGLYVNYRDISARKRADRERADMEVQLRHALKLESIGQLAAGIAHEINTPAQYIGDNARFLKDAFRDVGQLLQQYQGLLAAAIQEDLACQATSGVLALARSVDEEYLVGEIPKAIDQIIEGIERVSTLVVAMKEFSHPGTKDKTPADLNRGIANTIAVARNEWKYVAEMETDYDASLPLVPCLLGELNQVILNLIVNAAHAISDVVPEGQSGRIIVRTRRCENWAEIQVEDSGAGIPEHARDRIFDPFFTTKEVGRGTGQGLAIARSVVVDKHGGTIHFATKTGKGTTFTIRLPLSGASSGDQSQTAGREDRIVA